MNVSDPYDLHCFVDAQRDCYERVCQELSEGYEQSHWMWFIFPQLKGLGHSAMANLYGISSLQEARAQVRIRAIWFTRFKPRSASPSTFSVRLEE